MKLKKYLARSLLDFSIDQLWTMLTGRFILRFDNGAEIETNFKDVIHSSYAWEFHRLYRKTPLLPKHLTSVVIGNGRMGSSTHLKALGNAINSAHDAYITDRAQQFVTLDNGETIDVDEFKDRLAELEYRNTNLLYNHSIHNLEAYVVGIDMKQIYEVMSHPTILNTNNALPHLYEEIERKWSDRNYRMKEGQKIIDNAHDVVRKTAHTAPELRNNPLAQVMISGLVNESQTLQVISARGYLTDINSDLFTDPILVGYGHGLRTIHDSGIESRSASKSLLFTKDPLREAEYFSRRLQLVSFNLQNLHHGDCGSTDYIELTIRDTEYAPDGKVKTKSDLDTFQGKIYLAEDGTLKALQKSDKHLIGRQIKMRSVRHCWHEDPVGVCSTCVGELVNYLPKGSNLGHVACVTLASKSSQNVMSIKHNDGNSNVDSIVLSPEFRHLLKVSMDGNSYMLEPSVQKLSPRIIIRSEDAGNLNDIFLPKRVEEMAIGRVTNLTNIAIQVIVEGVPTEPVPVMVALGNRLASFTHPMLNLIKRNGWSHNERGHVVIDMEGWDYQDAFLSLPMKHFNMSDHSKELADMLESTVTELEIRDKEVDPTAFMLEFHDVVNQKLDVNFAVNEIVVYASMIVSAENRDYGIPKPWTTAGLGVKDITMRYRSLAAEMAHESHHAVLLSPASYVDTNRMPHPFDGVLMPFEMYQHKYGFAPQTMEPSSQQF